MMIKDYNGVLPKDYDLILKFPGIGSYTANALLALLYNKPTIALDGNVKRVFSRILNKEEKKINFNKFINDNKKNLFKLKNRNNDFAEAMIEFGALICQPKEPQCINCNIKKFCKYFKSKNKFKKITHLKTYTKSYDIFCYLNKKNKKIALTKNNNLGFLNKFNLPMIKEQSNNSINKNWKFLCKYKNFISNKKLNINLYYKFSNKLPFQFNWYKLKKNNEFIPTFTKNIFKQLLKLF
jgi:A/G-specific adenine glycosylase